MKAKKKELSINRWTRSADKEQYWRMHLQAWAASGLSIRAYCQENGVVETSLYAWRRELGIREREQTKENAGECAEKTTVKDRRGRAIPRRFREDLPVIMEGEDAQQNKTSPFMRLNLVEDSPKPKQEETKNVVSEATSIGITITTPAGYSISLTQASDIDRLKSILEKLEDGTC